MNSGTRPALQEGTVGPEQALRLCLGPHRAPEELGQRGSLAHPALTWEVSVSGLLHLCFLKEPILTSLSLALETGAGGLLLTPPIPAFCNNLYE